MLCHFYCEKDKKELSKILGYNLQMVCGKKCEKNFLQIQNLQKELLDAIESIDIVPNGPNEELDALRMVGFTNTNAITGTSNILMKGFDGSTKLKYKEVQHTFSHELFHSIYCLMNRKKDGKNSKGKRLHWTRKK